MIIKKGLNKEIKFTKIVKTEEGYEFHEYDKDNNFLRIVSEDELFGDLIDTEYVNIKLDFVDKIDR